MEATMRKIGALCAKDFPDLFKNPVMVISALLPIVFSLWYSSMIGGDLGSTASSQGDEAAVQVFLDGFMLSMGASMTAGMVPSMIVLYSIAEEKEKHTLRTLMLANVSGGQVLAAKSIVALVVSAVVNAVIYLLAGFPLANLAAFLAITLLGTVPIVLLSLVLGLAARDQMSSGLFSLPIVILALCPIFGILHEDVGAVLRFTPTGGMSELISLLGEGNLFTQEALQPLLIMFVWIALTAVLFLVLYKRLGRDN